MFAITHKIKNAIQSKDYVLIRTDSCVIYAGWLNYAQCYVINVKGLAVYFDTFQLVNGSIWFNKDGKFVGSFSEERL